MKTSKSKFGIVCGSIAAALTLSPAFAESSPTASSNNPPATTEARPTDKTAGERWSDRIFDEFQEMQQRMDRILNDALRQVEDRTDWFHESGFASSFKLSEDEGEYVVRVSLPDRDLNNVVATVENDNVLRVTAKEEKKEKTTTADKDGDKTATSATYEMGRYEQLLTLPGPVDASKMKIDRLGSTVTITLPKSLSADTPPAKR